VNDYHSNRDGLAPEAQHVHHMYLNGGNINITNSSFKGGPALIFRNGDTSGDEHGSYFNCSNTVFDSTSQIELAGSRHYRFENITFRNMNHKDHGSRGFFRLIQANTILEVEGMIVETSPHVDTMQNYILVETFTNGAGDSSRVHFSDVTTRGLAAMRIAIANISNFTLRDSEFNNLNDDASYFLRAESDDDALSELLIKNVRFNIDSSYNDNSYLFLFHGDSTFFEANNITINDNTSDTLSIAWPRDSSSAKISGVKLLGTNDVISTIHSTSEINEELDLWVKIVTGKRTR